MRLGFYGGTFDPVHNGHLDVAHAARAALKLDTVTFVPARVPPHRALPRVSPAHRFAMVALALQGRDGLSVSDVEMNADGPSYTSSTIDRLEASGVGLNDAAVILGADAFREIETWKAYPAFLDRCTFAVVSRPEDPVARLPALLPALAPRMIDSTHVVRSSGRVHIVLVDAPTAPISSTDIRRRVAEGASIDQLVPTAVAEYIHTHGFYLETHTPAS